MWKRKPFLFTGSLLVSFWMSGPAWAQISAQPTVTPVDVPSETRRDVVLHGQVVLEDGTPLSEPAEIVRVCGSMTRRETYTNTEGNFSFRLTPNSTNSNFQGADQGGGTATFGAQMGKFSSTTTRTLLWGCELHASVNGYTSSSVSLEGKDFSMPVDVGRIVLRPVQGIPSGTISVTSMKAPDQAKKEFDKGRKDFFHKNYSKAEKHLLKATELFPEYAAAWEFLGRTQRLQKRDNEAEKSFLLSIKADDKYVPPYMQLAGIDALHGRWQDVLNLTAKILAIDPSTHPDAFFLNAIAHYNLKQMQDAEISAQKAVDTDKAHQFPRATLLLGRILQNKGDDRGAAEQFRNYIKLEPNSPEVPHLEAYLAKFDRQANVEKTEPKAN